MALFTVISMEPDGSTGPNFAFTPPATPAAVDTLQTAIEAVVPKGDWLSVRPKVWLVSYPGIAKNLADDLGITKGEHGVAIVLACTGYFGWAQNSIWEWIASKQQQDSNKSRHLLDSLFGSSESALKKNTIAALLAEHEIKRPVVNTLAEKDDR